MGLGLGSVLLVPLPDSAASPLVFPADILEDFAAADLLAGLFATPGTALMLLSPIWAEAGTTVVDFKVALLSAAAQQLLRQPARPAVTHRGLMPGPDTENMLDFYRAAFTLGQPAQRDFTYQLDGCHACCHLAVRRVGAGLLVSLSDTAGAVRGVVDVAVEVTEQVLARRLIEEKEQQTNRLNEELQAANAEILANNDELHRTQHALRELNHELEARVADRTHALSQALAKTEQQRESLRQQQYLLMQVLSQVPASVATLEGPEHRYTFFNTNYQMLAGGRARLGLTVAEVLPELVPQGFIELLNGVFATGTPYVGIELSVLLYDPLTGQPEQRFVDFVYQPLTDEANRPHGVLAFVIDTTDKVLSRSLVAQTNECLTTANTALDTTNRQLTRTNADLDNFVYAASHDLRQPINNLVGLFEELRQAVAFTDPTEEGLLLPMLHQALHQLSTTIDDLALVGQTRQNTGLPTEPVSLQDLTQEVLQTLQPQVQAARARVTVDFAAVPMVVYSRANMRTILLNLLSNSLKYADPARPCRVHISVWKDAGHPVLLVEDNGLGFNMNRHHDELFQLFRRFHTHTEGTGVGLYLINRIVQGNGGRIEVESEVGEGTSFRVYL